ncbi:hypothetical protein GCM10018980_11490 [Streptomyces capoamus]|uniref:Uncharacterized protein n=1 Tax=Streptomyces capoamus TaxID=68183 RepID=A0A919C0X6_9ACTN|nr:hypothetical protein GCM10010501_34410 [Streptomyces libani subsp. rufus]GHG38592.1 hypothetical protein GCM10018980_11490 [Streptomyces capoamus]
MDDATTAHDRASDGHRQLGDAAFGSQEWQDVFRQRSAQGANRQVNAHFTEKFQEFSVAGRGYQTPPYARAHAGRPGRPPGTMRSGSRGSGPRTRVEEACGAERSHDGGGPVRRCVQPR